MTSTNASSFFFQPWARGKSDEGALKDILARVNLERGHFRGITEASLQEEMAAEGVLELSESESDEETEEEADEARNKTEGPKTREDLFRAKHEMLTQVAAAQQEILYSLDFISLLESKDAPKQAQSTLSPALKSTTLPLGTLGTDIWQRMPVDKSKDAQDELIATNVRMQALQQSADNLLTAATRLQTNVQTETQYWSQILAISEEGWNVCRIPGQQHRLGVSFGFSESGSTFSRRGVAELTPNSSGHIMLERAIGSRPKALRVVFCKNGGVIGMSRLPLVPDPAETTLEARIRYARDSLFDEELYHEMIRESRTMASFGVAMEGSKIELGFAAASSSDIKVSFDLVSLDQGQGLDTDSTTEQDNAAANAIILATRLLLSQAHRDRLKKRSGIPPPLSEQQSDDNSVLPILRPVMSLIMHRSAMNRLNVYVETVASVIEKASVENSRQLARSQLEDLERVTTTEALITTLFKPWISEANLIILDSRGNEINFGLKVQTTLGRGFGSTFELKIRPETTDLRFDSVEELFEAADMKLASALTKSLAGTMDSHWKCREQEALIVKDVGIGEKAQSIWVSLDSKNKMLSLNSLVKKLVWKVEGNGPPKGFWDSKYDIL